MTIQERSASKRNRQRQQRAEVRLDEIVVVADIESEYEKVDRAGDNRMESHFRAMWALADDEEERDAISRAYADWGKGEQLEGMTVAQAVAHAVETLKRNNPFFIDGAWCPPDSEGAA